MASRGLVLDTKKFGVVVRGPENLHFLWGKEG